MVVYRNLLIIGSSTGGPRILERIFSDLPRLNASIIIVHQMVKMMNPLLRDRIARVTDMPVLIAEDSMLLNDGKIYLAPSDLHLKVNNNSVINLLDGERVNNVRPSIDVAMKSVGAGAGGKIVGMILTGAGKDGVEGIQYIKNIGGITIAQEEHSSPVSTLPKTAVDTGCIDMVLTPEEISEKLTRLLG